MHSRKIKPHRRIALAALLLLAAGTAAAQSVTLNGNLGAQKALLVIDGLPHAVTVGTTVKGVRLVSLSGSQAEVAMDGARRTLLLGSGPVKASGNAGARSGNEIVLMASHGGHFNTVGQINGKSVSFMVDTGATKVSMGQAEAKGLGVD